MRDLLREPADGRLDLFLRKQHPLDGRLVGIRGHLYSRCTVNSPFSIVISRPAPIEKRPDRAVFQRPNGRLNVLEIHVPQRLVRPQCFPHLPAQGRMLAFAHLITDDLRRAGDRGIQSRKKRAQGCQRIPHRVSAKHEICIAGVHGIW